MLPTVKAMRRGAHATSGSDARAAVRQSTSACNASTSAPAVVTGGLLAVGLSCLVLVGSVSARQVQLRYSTHGMASSSAHSHVVYVPTVSDAGDGSDGRVTTFSRITPGDADDERRRPLTCGEVLELWRDSDAFRDAFVSSLRDEPFDAFFWETPGLTRHTLSRPYEHVVKRAPGLEKVRPEPEVFREHLTEAVGCGDGTTHAAVATFSNLGGDAVLVSPCEHPSLAGGAGAHFASFLRGAAPEHAHALLRAVAVAVESRLGEFKHDRPLWVSTSGAGVSWLHVRLDERPKYYTFTPYARWPYRGRG